MARINGVEPRQAGWLTRLLYWFTRRSLRKITGQDRLPEPVKIVAHHPAPSARSAGWKWPRGRRGQLITNSRFWLACGLPRSRAVRSEWTLVLPWAERKVLPSAS